MNRVNGFIVEGILINLEETETGSILKLEYAEDMHLDILFEGMINQKLKENYRQFRTVRVVGKFIGNQKLKAEYIDFK